MRVAICDDENTQLSITKTSIENAYKSLDLIKNLRKRRRDSGMMLPII